MAESGRTLARFERSTVRSRVATRLTSSTVGTGSPSAHSTCSICAPYLASRCSNADFALVFHSLPSGCVHSGSATAGSGNHACAVPDGATISTRVVISNLRHAPGCGANGASAKAPRGSPPARINAVPLRKNSRRSIRTLPCRERNSAYRHPSARHLPKQARKCVPHIGPCPVYVALCNEARLQIVIEHDGRRQRVDAPCLGNGAVAI